MKENLFIRKYSFVMNGTATARDFQEEHMWEKKKELSNDSRHCRSSCEAQQVFNGVN